MGRPSYGMSSDHMHYRTSLFRELYKAKMRLCRSYEAQSSSRVLRNKRKLVRLLRELTQSPQIGNPPVPFKWPKTLAIYWAFNNDPTVPASFGTITDWKTILHILEKSIEESTEPILS